MSSQDHAIRRTGLKVTRPRLEVLQLLEQADVDNRHLSAEEIYRTLHNNGHEVGRGTVYRVLTQLETVGLVERHNFDDHHCVFEAAQGNHHDHMVCLETGEVTEFVNSDIERLQAQVARKHGYEIVGHRLVLFVRPRRGKG